MSGRRSSPRAVRRDAASASASRDSSRRPTKGERSTPASGRSCRGFRNVWSSATTSRPSTLSRRLAWNWVSTGTPASAKAFA